MTQAFNTTTSMGRLTLNVLLSFAQFEREVIGERIRDKFAACRARGMWMGGWAPLGYDIKDRKLVVNEAEAALVRRIFERFVRLGSATKLVAELSQQGVLHKRGKPIDKGFVYKLLNNRLYLGEAVHKGQSHPGEHEAIVSQALWDKVHAIMAESPRKRASNTRAQTPALLKGLIFGPTGHAMAPTHTRRRGRLYRYYVSTAVLKQGRDACPVGRVPAGEIEAAVLDQLRHLIASPELIVRTWRAAREQDGAITEAEVRNALLELDPLWDELFPAEQARIVQLLVERVDIGESGVTLRLRTEGLTSLVQELRAGAVRHEAGGMSAAARIASSEDGRTVTVELPLAFRKRGGRKQVVSPAGAPSWAPRRPQVQSTLVKAIARAHRWRAMLEDGTYASAAELSAAERINPSYVARLLRLTLLAPEIVEAVLNGTHSPALTLDRLMKPFPTDWDEQRQCLLGTAV